MKSEMSEISTFTYTRLARGIHWLMAILIIGMLTLGWFMVANEDEPGGDKYFMIHISIGVILFSLVFLRLIWRFNHPPGRLPAQLSHLQVRVSKISHWCLYGVMFLMPFVGLMGILLNNDEAVFFGYQIPRLITANQSLSELFFSFHTVIAWIFAGLISVHILAALKHLFINKDGVFQRMWF